MKRFDNNGKAVWGASRHDSYPTYRFGGRTQRAGRRDGGGFNRPIMDEGDGEPRQPEDTRREDNGPTNLNQVLERLERLEKLGSGRFDSDHRFENLEHSWPRGTANPSVFDDRDDWELEEARRLRYGGNNGRSRYPNGGFRDGQQATRPGRDNWGRNGPGWTTQGSRNPRQPFGGFDQFDQSFDIDRHVGSLDSSWPRDTEAPSGFDEGDDGDYDDPRRLRSGGRFGRDGYPTYGPREGQHESRPGRDNWDRNGPVWTTQRLKMDPNLDFRDGPPEERARRDEKARTAMDWGFHGDRQPSFKMRPPRYQQHRQHIGGYDQQCSPYPAAVNDYNEKWRVYRLQHFPLLAELNATLKKIIDDVNLDGDVPIDEPLEEIVKADSTPQQVLVEAYDEKIDDLSVPTHKELEMREDKETLLEKENNAEAFRSSVEPKEIDFGVLMEKPSEIESIENHEDMEEKTIASFNVAQISLTDGANCGFKRGGACTGVRTIAYFYVDFVDADVPSIVHGSTSLDVDARFIPPGNDAPYLSVLGSDKGRHSTVRYAFDPGGDASPKLLLSTFRRFVVPTLRTRWILTGGS